MRTAAFFVARVFVVVSVMISGCQKKEPDAPKAQQQDEMTAAHGTSNAVAGIRWSVPERWGEHPPRQMRVATYMVPPADGDAEGGECAVFYFGSGQGGDVDANIERWAGQFENATAPQRSSKTVNGLNVTLVQIAGTYLAPAGPMMEATGKKENFRLLGAIVAAPEGFVFFKFTGPSATIAGAEAEFNQLVGSLTKP